MSQFKEKELSTKDKERNKKKFKTLLWFSRANQ